MTIQLAVYKKSDYLKALSHSQLYKGAYLVNAYSTTELLEKNNSQSDVIGVMISEEDWREHNTPSNPTIINL